MASFKIRFDQARFEKLVRKLKSITKDFINPRTGDLIGLTAVNGMKALIARGITPIRGGPVSGKFPAYKNKKKYPGNLKPPTPVNLKLTGDFLDSLTWKYVAPTTKQLGRTLVYLKDSEQEKKEYGHRYGANGQPKRPIMPFQNAGEKLAATIDSKIAKILRARLKELLNNK